MHAHFEDMMNIRIACSTAALLSFCAGAFAAAPPAAPGAVPLAAGTYVLDGAGKTCADVPNAGTVYFDGANLIGPHDHASHSVVASVSPDRATYVLDTRYVAYRADGSNASQTRSDTLNIAGRTRFHLTQDRVDRGDFHRCGPVPKLV
jgi:hypothetical protein